MNSKAGLVMDVCEVKVIHPEAIKKAREAMAGEGVMHLAAEGFKAFGDPTRLTIMVALTSGEMCVCDLAAILNLSSSAVSHQLRLLRQLRLVDFRKSGKIVYYHLADDHVKKLLEIGLEHAAEPASNSWT